MTDAATAATIRLLEARMHDTQARIDQMPVSPGARLSTFRQHISPFSLPTHRVHFTGVRMTPIPPGQFDPAPFSLLDAWLLLASGTGPAPGAYNAMTISWGGFGVMWGKRVATVAVRPTRHTYGFLERCDSFTLCAFPTALRPALEVCGRASGRDGDKVSQCGLTAVAASLVASPVFTEATLAIECRILASHALEPTRFRDLSIHQHYHDDHHRCYIGEIVAVARSD